MPHSMMLPADSDASCDSKDSNQISTQFEAEIPMGITLHGPVVWETYLQFKLLLD